MNQLSTSSTDDDADALFDEPASPDAPPPAQKKPADPATIAATCLLELLVTQEAEQGRPFSAAEVIILEAPSEAWANILANQIRPILYDGKIPLPNCSFVKNATPDESHVEVYRGKEFSHSQLDYLISARIFGDLFAGRSIWIVTEVIADSGPGRQHPELHQNHQNLPRQILATADRQLILPEMTQDLYGAFLAKVTGHLPHEDWAAPSLKMLTPGVLRLAARPLQTGDEYARRIARLICASAGGGTDGAGCNYGSRNDGATASASAISAVKPGLNELHGMPQVITWARSLAADLQDYKAGRLAWSEVDRGALLYGPPGTGKTAVARAIAGHCNVPFFPTSYAEWQSTKDGYLGDVTKAILDVFSKAREGAPSIIFIDELDSINSRTSRKTKYDDWWRAIINTLLEQLDGAGQRDGVIVLAATNDPRQIDPAILRSGRLDRQIPVAHPDAAALAKIYRHHLGNMLSETDFVRLGAITFGQTGADVERIARGARRRARRQRRDVCFDDVFTEIAGEMPAPGDPALWRTAIHEAGHATMTEALQPGRLRVVSIIGQGASAGSTISAAAERGTMTTAKVDEELVILLAGRAAEEIILGNYMGGCGGEQDSDLAVASWTAFTAETSLGLGTTGLLWSNPPDMDELHELLSSRPEATRAARARLDRAYERAKALTISSRPVIETIAEELLRKYVLTPEQLVPILALMDRGKGSTPSPPPFS